MSSQNFFMLIFVIILCCQVFDATNSTWDRRQMIKEIVVNKMGFKLFFVESVCDDPQIIEQNIMVSLLKYWRMVKNWNTFVKKKSHDLWLLKYSKWISTKYCIQFNILGMDHKDTQSFSYEYKDRNTHSCTYLFHLADLNNIG
jgi:hypothetical protein